MPTPRVAVCSVLFVLLPLAVASANDSAASIAAGGIQLRSERRIALRMERLTIREVKAAKWSAQFAVSVDYEFVNESAEEITTEVAFPVPEYGYEYERPFLLRDFRAWVDGVAIPVKKQVRALVNGQDRSALLLALGIDIEHHGNYSPDTAEGDYGGPNQFRDISERDLARLVAEGLVEGSHPERGWPRWRVAILWHWTQTFPPGKVVRVRHEYVPGAGYQGYRSPRAVTDTACPDSALFAALEREVAALGSRYKGTLASRVDYILTTANGWKGPIGDFELVVERPVGQFVSFCWDGKVEKVNATTFRAAAKDFTPTRNLTVYFLDVR